VSISAGTRLGRYEIGARLGAGAMGEVYSARDDRLKRDVAVKVLNAAVSTDAERLRRFASEAEAIGRLNHPNILAIFDVDILAPTPYLVCELLRGRTLADAIAAGGPLPLSRALDYAAQLVDGLSAAHREGVVHRDLKPQNLFITEDGRLKILDFGLAKLSASDVAEMRASLAATATAAGTVVGTLYYIAPEQLRSEPADARSDVFAVGAILFEMLTGRRAFDGRTQADVMTAILRDRPMTEDAGVKPDVHALVRRCLEKDPADRFQSAAALAVAIGECRSGPPSAAAAAQRRLRIPAVAGVAVLALAIGAAVWTRSSNHVGSLAVLRLRDLSADPTQQYFATEMTTAIASELLHLSGVRVLADVGAAKPDGSPGDLARRLGVESLLQGSVQRNGDRVKVSMTLTDGRTSRSLWTQAFDRPIADVLALEREIARAVSEELKATLSKDSESRPAARPVNPDANDKYLRGRFALRQTNEASIMKAIGLFNDAIVADPGDARAHAGLADAYMNLRSTYRAPKDVMPQAKASAATALQIDPGLAEGHVAMGSALMFWDYDWIGAEREFHRAIELSPNLASAHDFYGQLLATLGRKETAASEMVEAQQLDPLSTQVLNDASWVAYLGGDYPKMLALNQKALEIDKDYWPALRDFGLAYEKLGRTDEAIAALERARTLDSSPSILEMLGGAYATAGRQREAAAVADELTRVSTAHYVCPYEVATVYAGLGNPDEALKWLERGLQERADCMPWIRYDPKLDRYREDPKFAAILTQMGLPK
jgi:serine/threonine protein kinase/tetratricopeptide (TPR) repeat protein